VDLTVGGTPPAPAACLAVDAGNSKTDVALVAQDGTVLGSARGGGFRPPVVGVDSALDDLGATVERALNSRGSHGTYGSCGPYEDRTGSPHGGGGGERDGRTSAHTPLPPLPPLPQVSACLANVDLPREEERMAAAMKARGWGRTTHIANDTFAVLRAGLPDDGSMRHGVALVCGTGVNCVGRDETGRTHRFLALGRLSGDWGGGGGLSTEALWCAARAEDGRGEPTLLAEALPAHFGLASMAALIEALHLGDLPRERQYELAPLVFESAAEGDPVALGLVHRQADELVTMACATLDRLGLLDTPTPVFLGGSVVAARHRLLDDRLTEQLARRAPESTPHVVTAPPVLGAGLLGLDAAGAPPEAHARLRRQYARTDAEPGM
jgi:N-acetylglucosamine kinase-like BadF-type ATPase